MPTIFQILTTKHIPSFTFPDESSVKYQRLPMDIRLLLKTKQKQNLQEIISSLRPKKKMLDELNCIEQTFKCIKKEASDLAKEIDRNKYIYGNITRGDRAICKGYRDHENELRKRKNNIENELAHLNALEDELREITEQERSLKYENFGTFNLEELYLHALTFERKLTEKILQKQDLEEKMKEVRTTIDNFHITNNNLQNQLIIIEKEYYGMGRMFKTKQKQRLQQASVTSQHEMTSLQKQLATIEQALSQVIQDECILKMQYDERISLVKELVSTEEALSTKKLTAR